MPLNNIKPTQGRLLIAEPFLQDTFFKRAVVLLAEHNENGSFGFILNKPLDLKLNDVIDDFPKYTEAIYMGGPVNRNQLFYVHTLGKKIDESIEIAEGIFWGGNFNTVREMVSKKIISADDFRFFAGYSGWEANQLDKELKEKSWIVAETKADMLFDHEPARLWGNVLKSMGKEFSIMSNFPEDPSLN